MNKKFINIEVEMKRNNLTINSLSKEIGCSYKTLWNWINCKTEIPASVLIRFSEIFDCSVDYLLGINKSA